MSFTPVQLLSLVLQYKFLIIFPLAIVEGPIITTIAGFLVSMHLISFVPAFLLIVFADLVGDTLYYVLGRWGRQIGFKLPLDKIDSHFRQHSHRTLILGKFAHGAGSLVLIAAGASRMPFYEFLLYNLIPTVPKTFFFLGIGYFFGSRYQTVSSILDIFGYVVLAALIIAGLYWLGTSIWRKETELEQKEHHE